MRRVIGFVRSHPLIVAVSLLLMAEGVLMSFFMMPSSPSAEASTETSVSTDERVEISAGEYKVRNHQIPGDDHVLRFSVCLTTDPTKAESLTERYKGHEQRVREATAIVARRANAEVLAENSLATLKRRMRVAVANAMAANQDQHFDILLPDFLMQKG